MPILYISNSTKQPHNFNYRLPERDKVIMQQIAAGSQISINLQTQEIDWIIKQHEKYGLTNIKEVKNKPSFSGICYSVDRQIDVESIENAISVKDEVITERSLDARKNTAAAIEKSVSEQAREIGIEAGNTQVEIEEEKTNPADNEEKIKETIEVDGTKRRGRPRK
jgi:hypothetical protein